MRISDSVLEGTDGKSNIIHSISGNGLIHAGVQPLNLRRENIEPKLKANGKRAAL
jgi:hypothetical protein